MPKAATLMCVLGGGGGGVLLLAPGHDVENVDMSNISFVGNQMLLTNRSCQAIDLCANNCI